jgi:pimeloyl-ACP methyl ester carboxylesterase
MTPVLYLHGFASSPSSKKAQYFRHRMETAGFRVTVPDLAEGDFRHLTLTRQLQVMEAVAGGGPVSLIGSSMGGYLAALYAARHTEVERVVLLAPAFGFARRWTDYLTAEQIERWRATGSMEVFHYGEGKMMPLDYSLLEDAACYEEFPEVRQPILIFHGSEDPVVPVACSRQFAARHPDAILKILPSGHELLDALDQMANEVLNFLAA